MCTWIINEYTLVTQKCCVLSVDCCCWQQVQNKWLAHTAYLLDLKFSLSCEVKMVNDPVKWRKSFWQHSSLLLSFDLYSISSASIFLSNFSGSFFHCFFCDLHDVLDKRTLELLQKKSLKQQPKWMLDVKYTHTHTECQTVIHTTNPLDENTMSNENKK